MGPGVGLERWLGWFAHPFVYFVARGGVCPGASTAAKCPRSQVPACLISKRNDAVAA